MRKQEAALAGASNTRGHNGPGRGGTGRGGNGRARGGDGQDFTLYVEGPRDRSILRAWAYRLMPIEARPLFGGCVIMGGRRPERALEHFRGARVSRGLCVLDCDDDDALLPAGEEGLEFFTWTRRHIESYVLVPAAIERVLGLRPDDRRIERILAPRLPDPSDAASWRQLDAKQLLGRRGELFQALGQSISLARIARATREDELHADVHGLFARLREGLGPAPARGGGRPVAS